MVNSNLYHVLNIRNIVAILFVVCVSVFTGNIIYAVFGGVCCIYFIVQSLFGSGIVAVEADNSQFQRIKLLSEKCDTLYIEALKYINDELKENINRLMKNKSVLTQLLPKSIKQKQRMNQIENIFEIIAVFFKMIKHFNILVNDISAIDTSEINERITRNKQRLLVLKDTEKAENLAQLIQYDENLLKRISSEFRYLESVGHKLAEVENDINRFTEKTINWNQKATVIWEINSCLKDCCSYMAELEKHKIENIFK